MQQKVYKPAAIPYEDLKYGVYVRFVIGGSNGLSEVVLQRSNHRLCFSKMTFTHQMIRMILLEQIYRAFKISRGEPYHK
ncbi:MAG: 23S rRNA (pseudouridine(1915)-N(3))-methyltransferase RlmH [Treponema socranskii subsp. buccale]